MRIFGVFGDPIEHSLSPLMQNAAFKALGIDACMLPFRVSKDQLEYAILGAGAMGFGGLNLTIPLKEMALLIVQPDDLAMAIGAINTISFGREIIGHNTDGVGALRALEGSGVKLNGRKVLLIGAGGAARAIAYVLAKEQAEIAIANRNPKKAKDLAECICARGYGLGELERLIADSDVIINATSIGMNEGDPRLFEGCLLHKGQVVFDIVYNRKTELLMDAERAGAISIDGLRMLVCQGAAALEIWTGREAPLDVMEEAAKEGLKARRQFMVEQ